MCKNPPRRQIDKCLNFPLFFLVSDFLASCGEHIFGSIATLFALDDACRLGLITQGSIFKIKTFHLKPQNFFLGPFSDLEIFQLKTLYNGDAHIHSTLNHHHSFIKV